MNIKDFARPIALAVVAATAIAASSASAHAGFFDQLFGGGSPTAPEASPAPTYTVPPETVPDADAPRPISHSRHRVSDDRVASLQKTTDLMSDRTLRPGDAVMMKTGVHIYDGPQTSHHDADEFVALDQAHHLSPQTRDTLSAMDARHREPITYVASGTATVEGRSSGGPSISRGFNITDARGRSIRYVGP